MTTILTANIASRRIVRPLRPGAPSPLRVAIREHSPDVVVITEAYHARPWLRGVAKLEGYRLHQYTRDEGPEAPGIAVLVRRPLRVARRWPMRMFKRWTGPHGREHAPRTYPVFTIAERLLAAHLPSGGPDGDNAAAWAESWRRITAWMARHDQAIAVGDFNALQGELATRLPDGLQLVVGTKVDHAVTRGMRHVSTQRLKDLQPEGMHGWVVYKLQGRAA
jgi:hypothetical protein